MFVFNFEIRLNVINNQIKAVFKVHKFQNFPCTEIVGIISYKCFVFKTLCRWSVSKYS